MNGALKGLIAGASSLSLSLAACTGSLFTSKEVPPTIYTLSAKSSMPAAMAGAVTPGVVTLTSAVTGNAAPGAVMPASPLPSPAAQIPVDLAILKPRAHVGLATDRIAVLYPDRRLDYFADARWSGALIDVLQDMAVQEFYTHANLRNVSGDASVFGSAYWLEIEVADFQAEYTAASAAPTVHVRMMARIGSSSERRILGRIEASAQQAAAENRLTAIVDAYAQAADAAFAQIVGRSVDILRSGSETR